jgi:hypothetical protein
VVTGVDVDVVPVVVDVLVTVLDVPIETHANTSRL